MVPTTAATVCANTRCTYTHCLHIRLARCSIHPLDSETLSSTCPEPEVGFSSVVIEGECAACRLPATRSEIKALEQRLEQVSSARLNALEARMAMCCADGLQEKKRMGMKNAALDSVSKRLTSQIKAKKMDLEGLEHDTVAKESIGTLVKDEGDEGDGYCVVWWTAEVEGGLWKW